ncbi:hypothetical protein KKD19_04010 [Patescibacteria group bacterium]|nr:hypothetical protein [Patescibacteria group bacterium]MBU4512371.1 hypothetical protein [Patescibacteria group bacterium]
MEDKKQDKKNGAKNQKIPWYRRRWFWGMAILAVIIITGFFFYQAPQNDLRSIIDLIGGMFWFVPLGIIVVILAITGVNSTLWPAILIIFRILYLLLLALLLYKAFYKHRVKIIYPVLVIIVLIISVFFGILASSFV